MTRRRTTVWIGIVNVVPKKGNDTIGQCRGAYVNILTRAGSVDEFVDKIQAGLEAEGFVYVGLADTPEPFALRREKCRVSEDLKRLAAEVQSDDEVLFDTFMTFD